MRNSHRSYGIGLMNRFRSTRDSVSYQFQDVMLRMYAYAMSFQRDLRCIQRARALCTRAYFTNAHVTMFYARISTKPALSRLLRWWLSAERNTHPKLN